ncbi:kinesin-related protein [Dorcoceras hygrometricum]|uniref:Kinesin-related protein n=1 Tax=Dorcoceras hygrometricum TaxID=472368 RepID=A0A2Z7AS79_9LAMI|nr:kinesin-related protein [Dorcoceras hygrometricum]
MLVLEDERVTHVCLKSLMGSVSHYERSGQLPHLMSWATAGYHGFSMGRGVDPDGNAPGDSGSSCRRDIFILLFVQSSQLVSFAIRFRYFQEERAVLLSYAHRISLKYLLEQMRQHKLEWTQSCSSNLFERADVQSKGIHSRFYPSIKSTSWPVVQYISSSSSSASSVSIRPRSQDAISSSSSSSASSMHFTEHIPQTSMPTVVVLYADYTESFAQLRTCVDQIQLEQVRTRDDIAELKAALSSKITNLEAAFAHASANQERVFRNQIYDFQQEIKTRKAALSQDLNDFRKKTQEGITTLSAQLSEIIAYINRGHDDKKGK